MCAPFIPVNLPITGNQYQNRELPHGNVSRSEVEHHRSKDIPDVIKEGKKPYGKTIARRLQKPLIT